VCKTSKQGNSRCNVHKIGQHDPFVACNGAGPLEKLPRHPPNCLYNMDELGNDTTKHCKKVIVAKTDDKAKEIRTFLKTPEGDGCMPWHIIVCLMTCADGEYMVVLVDCCFIIVHSKLVHILCEKVSWLIVERGRGKRNFVSFHPCRLLCA